MGISGSQPALTESRFGQMRFGTFRFGSYSGVNVVLTVAGTVRNAPDPILAINGRSTLTIEQTINDEPDTARFTLRPSAGFTPIAGQTIGIGFGDAYNLEFGGQISIVTARYERGITNPYYDIEATDYGRLLDRRVINTEYPSMSATDIVIDLVANYTSGFSTFSVASGLATIDAFPLTNETVTGALRRLANLIGGAFYIDAFRNLHFFGPSGDASPRAGTNPAQLAAGNTLWKSFQYSSDVTQERTRVYVEGQTAPLAVDLGVGAGIVPIVTGSVVFPSSGLIRIATRIYAYTGFIRHAPDVILFDGAIVTSAAAVGATTLAVSETSDFAGGLRALQIGDQYITATGTSVPLGPGNVTGIPAAGAGAITQPIEVGATVRNANQFIGITDQRTGLGYIQANVKAGEPIVMVTQIDDAAAQAAVAAIEGGDGIHEHVIQDERLSADGSTDRGQGDLDTYSDAVITAEWVTTDMNARPGRQQSINFGSLATTLLITRSEISFPVPNGLPWRRCEASSVKQPGLIDAITSMGWVS